MTAALFAVASGFVLLGGWVWSERRDRLTRPFYLLCLAFAVLLVSPPLLEGSGPDAAYQLLNTAATLLLPALCVHFFSAVSRAARVDRPAGQRCDRGVRGRCGALCGMGRDFRASAGGRSAARAGHVGSLQAGGRGVVRHRTAWRPWRSSCAPIARAGTVDARRRLRVALVGTTLGLGPLAALIGVAQSRSRSIGARRAIRGRAHVAGSAVVHLGDRDPPHLRFSRRRCAPRSRALLLSVTAGAVYIAGELATSAQSRSLRLWRPLAGDDRARRLAGRVRRGRSHGRWVASLLPLREDASAVRDACRSTRSDGAPPAERCSRAPSRCWRRRSSSIAVSRSTRRTGNAASGARMAIVRSDLRNWGATCSRRCAANRHRSRSTSSSCRRRTARPCAEAAVHWVLPVGAERSERAAAPRPAAGRPVARSPRGGGPWCAIARHVALTLENVSLRHSARTHGERGPRAGAGGRDPGPPARRAARRSIPPWTARPRRSRQRTGGRRLLRFRRAVFPRPDPGGGRCRRARACQRRCVWRECRRASAPRCCAARIPARCFARSTWSSLARASGELRGPAVRAHRRARGRVHLANAGLEPPLLRRSGGE